MSVSAVVWDSTVGPTGEGFALIECYCLFHIFVYFLIIYGF